MWNICDFAFSLRISFALHSYIYLLLRIYFLWRNVYSNTFFIFNKVICLCFVSFWAIERTCLFFSLIPYQIFIWFVTFYLIPQVGFSLCWFFPWLCRNVLFFYCPIHLFWLFLPIPLLSSPRNYCQIQCHKVFPRWFLLGDL